MKQNSKGSWQRPTTLVAKEETSLSLAALFFEAMHMKSASNTTNEITKQKLSDRRRLKKTN